MSDLSTGSKRISGKGGRTIPFSRHFVKLSPEELRLHRALEESGWTGVMDEFNDAARLKNQCIPEPILVTTNGTILAGYGRWRLALLDGTQEIECIEYPLSEDEALQFILAHHQPRHGWNAFFRTLAALTMEPHLQQMALDNMRAGGKYKGMADLPDLQRIDVRQQIASIAGVGARNVSKVKTILGLAHPRLIDALRDGTLTINGATQLCKLPPTEQLEQFVRRIEERETSQVIRRSITRPRKQKTSPNVRVVLDALQQQEARQPGSVSVQVGRLQRTIVLVGQDLFTSPHSREELNLK